jgi:hypothetical protein
LLKNINGAPEFSGAFLYKLNLFFLLGSKSVKIRAEIKENPLQA